MHKFCQRALLALSVNIVIVLLAGAMQFMFTSSARATAGDLFVTDSVTNSIVAYSTDGTMRTFASGLDDPQGLTFDAIGYLYVADAVLVEWQDSYGCSSTWQVFQRRGKRAKSNFLQFKLIHYPIPLDHLGVEV